MKNLVLVVTLFTAVLFLAPQKIDAYPGFGKKMVLDMKTSCQTCHVGFPKLNSYGERIKAMGYDVPEYEPTEDEKHDMSAFFRAYRKAPVAIRVKSDAVNGDVRSGDVSDGLRAVQLLSAGNALNNKLSWWFHKHIVENNELVSLFEGAPHEAWLQYNRSDALRIRVGMFELPLWFSPSKTKLSELGYLYYGATTNDDNLGLLSAPQFGVQAYGHIAKKPSDEDDWWSEPAETDYTQGYNYAVSVTNGRNSFESNFSTVFGRITKKHPVLSTGLYALAGVKKTEVAVDGVDEDHHGDESGGHHDESDEDSGVEVKRDVYYRLGADLDMRWNGDRSNVYGSFVYGKDFDNTFVGGFLGYDQLVDKLLFTLRWDMVGFLSNPATDHNEEDHGGHHEDHGDEGDHHSGGHMHGDLIQDDAIAYSFGAYYLIWQNVRVGGEYRLGRYGIDDKLIFGLQFAF